jgi:thiamine monophosphate kinase
LNELSVKRFGKVQALQFALTGGDDYQLLFTAPKLAYNDLKALNCHNIGMVEKLPALNSRSSNELDWVFLDSKPVKYKNMGYQHF